MTMRSGICEVEMHKECKAQSALECTCRCHDHEPITLPDVHRSQFGFSLREDGQIILLSEDDTYWHPVCSFHPAWLKDLSAAADDAAKRFAKEAKI